MRIDFGNIRTVVLREWQHLHRERNLKIIYFPILLILALAVFIGWENANQWNSNQSHYQKIVESQWEKQPNRHPHRASHYGYLVFREKYPLSAFDFGLNSFVGNSVFLEAHRQNTVNMSEAVFSNEILRFGELSMAWSFQVIIPLFIIFIGFASVSSLKSNGILKLIMVQGCSYRELLFGKVLGIYAVTMVYFMPLLVLGLSLICYFTGAQMPFSWPDLILRSLLLIISYSLYLLVFVGIVVLVSAFSKSSKDSLLILLIYWFVMIFVYPRTAQSLGEYCYPAPNKNEFDARIYAKIRLQGDSHNPKDKHYQHLQDSLLKKYKVTRLEDLPVNYAGIQLYEGEKISSRIFGEEFEGLIDLYAKQNRVGVILAYLNPYLAIHNLSMLLSGSSFWDAVDFQRQVEKYRYTRTQKLNMLQAEKTKFFSDFQQERLQKIDQQVLASMPVFHYQPLTLKHLLSMQLSTFLALFFLAVLIFYLCYISYLRLE